MNSHRILNFLEKLLIVSVCLVVGMGVSQAQNNTSTDGSSQQEAERLQKQIELHRQIQQLQGGGQVPGAQGVQKQAPQGPVTFRPEDTGQSMITFSLGTDTPKPTRVAIKTNLLYGASTLTPNLGVEMGLGGRTSIALSAGYNKWGNMWDFSVTGPDYDPENIYKRKLDHISGKLEFRYWFRRRFEGHFVGAHLVYADYEVGEVGLKPVFEKRSFHDGNLYGGGLTYGYFWQWNPHWGMEFTLGLGAAVFEYESKSIEIGDEGVSLVDPLLYRKTYVGPTSAGISLVFKL